VHVESFVVHIVGKTAQDVVIESL